MSQQREMEPPGHSFRSRNRNAEATEYVSPEIPLDEERSISTVHDEEPPDAACYHGKKDGQRTGPTTFSIPFPARVNLVDQQAWQDDESHDLFGENGETDCQARGQAVKDRFPSGAAVRLVEKQEGCQEEHSKDWFQDGLPRKLQESRH